MLQFKIKVPPYRLRRDYPNEQPNLDEFTHVKV